MDIYTNIPLRLVFAEPEHDSWERLTRMARGLEDLGLTGLVAADHIVHYGWELPDHQAMVGRLPDVFTMMTAIAAVTTRVRIVSRIVVLPYRQPFATAHAIASIDVLSGGRATLGAAAGYAPVEYETFGIPIKERGPRTDEYLRLIRELWANPKVDFDGRYYSAKGIGLLLRPVQEPGPPIWIGGFSHRAAQRAVDFGDAWTPNCYTYPPDRPGARNSLTRQEFIEETSWANQHCEDRGRDRLHYVLSSGPGLRVTEKPAHPGRAHDDITAFSGEGTVSELIDEYRSFKQAGADSFYVSFSGDTEAEYFDNAAQFMQQVVPALD